MALIDNQATCSEDWLIIVGNLKVLGDVRVFIQATYERLTRKKGVKLSLQVLSFLQWVPAYFTVRLNEANFIVNKLIF